MKTRPTLIGNISYPYLFSRHYVHPTISYVYSTDLIQTFCLIFLNVECSAVFCQIFNSLESTQLFVGFSTICSNFNYLTYFIRWKFLHGILFKVNYCFSWNSKWIQFFWLKPHSCLHHYYNRRLNSSNACAQKGNFQNAWILTIFSLAFTLALCMSVYSLFHLSTWEMP